MSTERDTIAEIIAKTFREGFLWGQSIDADAKALADALLGVFDITPRKKEEDAAEDLQWLAELPMPNAEER